MEIRTSNSIGRLIVASPSPRTTNHPRSLQGVVRSREPFKFWWAPTISLERLKLEDQILYTGRLYHIQPKDDKPPLKGRGQCHVAHSSISTPAISGTAKATVAKFCMQIECIQCLAFDDKLLPNGRGFGRVTCFLNFAPIVCL